MYLKKCARKQWVVGALRGILFVGVQYSLPFTFDRELTNDSRLLGFDDISRPDSCTIFIRPRHSETIYWRELLLQIPVTQGQTPFVQEGVVCSRSSAGCRRDQTPIQSSNHNHTHIQREVYPSPTKPRPLCSGERSSIRSRHSSASWNCCPT